MCDTFNGWDHHAAFPAMVDLIPSLWAFTDCLDNTKQECDKVGGKDEAVWLIAAPGLSTRIQCVLRMRMPSCTSTQCQSNTSAQVSHHTVQSSPNNKSAQGETSQPPPSSNTCTLLLTVWHNMIKCDHSILFIIVHIRSLVCFCWVLRGIGCSSRSENLCAVTTGALQGWLVAGVTKVHLIFIYIAVLRRADLYLQ